MIKRTVFAALFALTLAWLLSSGVATAAFYGQTLAGGMVFRSLSLDLQISNSSSHQEPAQFFSEVSLVGASDLIPGGPIHTEPFWVKNVSRSPKTLKLYGQFLGNPPPSSFDELLQIRITTEQAMNSGWMTLKQWSETGSSLEDGELLAGLARRYQFEYRLLPRYVSDPDGSGPLQDGDLVGEEIFTQQSGPWSFALHGVVQERQ